MALNKKRMGSQQRCQAWKIPQKKREMGHNNVYKHICKPLKQIVK